MNISLFIQACQEIYFLDCVYTIFYTFQLEFFVIFFFTRLQSPPTVDQTYAYPTDDGKQYIMLSIIINNCYFSTMCSRRRWHRRGCGRNTPAMIERARRINGLAAIFDLVGMRETVPFFRKTECRIYDCLITCVWLNCKI